MEILSISHRGLRRFIEQNNPRALSQDLVSRIQDVVQALAEADDLAQFITQASPGWHVHRLARHRGTEWSVSVSANWRITFEIRAGVVSNLNLEDYH